MVSERPLYRDIGFPLALVVVVAIAGCVPWLRVRVTPGDPPLFSVSGTPSTLYSRGVDRLSVSEGGIVIWEIRAIGNAQTVDGLVYGNVPNGFRQVVPAEGDQPPQLRRGVSYTLQVTGSAIGRAMFDWQGVPTFPPVGLERLL